MRPVKARPWPSSVAPLVGGLWLLAAQTAQAQPADGGRVDSGPADSGPADSGPAACGRLCYFRTYMRKYREDGRHIPGIPRQRELHKHYQRRRRYGLTREEYEAMLERQQGACAICKRTEKRLVVDHGHMTRTVRGLLCDMCNHAVGYLEGWIAEVGPQRFSEYLRT